MDGDKIAHDTAFFSEEEMCTLEVVMESPKELKIKLYGLKGIRTENGVPSNVNDELQERYRKAGLDKPKRYGVIRIMTGSNVGYWIPADTLSGDSLTYLKSDAIGAMHPDVVPANISDVEMFEVDVSLNFEGL